MFIKTNTNELYHHGILGMKWGVRRYQNEDGSLTSAGKNRYRDSSRKAEKISSKFDRSIQKNENEKNKTLSARSKNRDRISAKYDKKIERVQRDIDSYNPILDGLKDSKGRDILTKDDVASMVSALNKTSEKLKAKRDSKLKDFDDGTEYVTEGYEKYSAVMKNYRDVKISALDDRAYKGSQEYKSAVRTYANQVLSDMMNYKSGTILSYAGEFARTDKYKG